MAKTPKKDGTADDAQGLRDASDTLDAAAKDDVIDADAIDMPDPEQPQETASDAENDLDGSDTAGDDLSSGEEADEITPTPTMPDLAETRIVERKGGFIPMVLGGVVAAGIGFFGAQYYNSTMTAADADLAAMIAAQKEAIADLSARLDGLPQVDTSALEGGLSKAQARIEALTAQVDAIDKKIVALANRPVASGSGTADLSAVTAQLDELRAALDTQEGTIARMLDAAQAEKHDTEEIARQTMARAAITRILVALESGAPFDDALADVDANTDADIPEALAQSAASGVPTVAALSETFPEAARAALAASRSETPTGGISSFLTRQLGVRSVEPREGDDPDAVLSRMEAAVRDGRLEDALAEMDSLPDVAKAPLAEWSDRATLRLTAVQEAEALANSLNSQ